jgi:hypothetical protein
MMWVFYPNLAGLSSPQHASRQSLGHGHALAENGVALAIGELPTHQFCQRLPIHVHGPRSGSNAFGDDGQAALFLDDDIQRTGLAVKRAGQAHTPHLGRSFGEASNAHPERSVGSIELPDDLHARFDFASLHAPSEA